MPGWVRALAVSVVAGAAMVSVYFRVFRGRYGLVTPVLRCNALPFRSSGSNAAECPVGHHTPPKQRSHFTCGESGKAGILTGDRGNEG